MLDDAPRHTLLEALRAQTTAAPAHRRALYPLSQRYIAAEILPALIIGLAAFTFILLIQVLLSRFRLVLATGIEGTILLQLLVCVAPSVLLNTASFALLLAVLAVYGRMAEDREFLAMTAGGISYRHMAQPPVLIGALLGVLLLFVAHVVAPRGVRVQYSLLQTALEQIARKSLQEGFNRFDTLDVYVRQRSEVMLKGIVLTQRALVDKGNGETEPVVSVAVAPEGSVVFDPVRYSSSLRLLGGELSFPIGGGGHIDLGFESLLLDVDITAGAQDLARRLGRERALPTPALRQEITALRQQVAADRQRDNRDALRRLWRLEQILHQRSSLPFSCIVFALLAAPLGLMTAMGKRAWAFLTALTVGFAYFLLQTGCDDLAHDGVLPGLAAAWAPNAVFLLVAVALNYWVAQR